MKSEVLLLQYYKYDKILVTFKTHDLSILDVIPTKILQTILFIHVQQSTGKVYLNE